MNDIKLNPAWRYWWPDLFLIGILALLPCLFFWRLITPSPTDQMHIAAGDFTEQYFPLRAFAAQEWVRGQIPLWNPYLYGGQPALADIQSGALYPLHILEALILGWGGPLFGQEVGFPLWALEWQVILHFSLVAVGTFMFVRHIGLRYGMALRRARFGGVIAALVFTYSGYLTGFPVQQLTILEVSTWLPWLLWGLSAAFWRAKDVTIQRQLTGRQQFLHSFVAGLRPAGWAALAFALAILAGHPQTVLYIFYLTLAFTIFQAFHTWWSTPNEISNRTDNITPAPPPPRSLNYLLSPLGIHFTLWGVAILLGTAIVAAQLLPTLEFISHSVRADLSYQAVSAGLPLNELISILYPGFFGGSPEYVGIAPLVLIAIALILAKPRGMIFFWAGAGLISLLLAFGGHLFLYPLFYLLAPGFDAVRQQERAFLIYSFSAAMLAGYGAMILAGPLSKISRSTYILFERRLRIVAGVALGLTGFYIYGSATATARGDEVNLFFGVLRHHLFGLIFLGGMILLLSLRPRRSLHRPWGMGLVAIWVAFNLFTVNWRFNLATLVDVESFTPNNIVRFLQTNLHVQTLADSLTRPLSPGRIASGGLLPGGNSAASVYNLQDLTGNTPLQLARVDTFLRQIPAWRLWQLMNVRYILEQRDISNEALPLVFEEGELRVFEMGDPFERAWLVSDVEVVTDESQAIARLADDDFNLRQTAIVEAPLRTPLGDASASTATVIDYSPTQLSIAVKATGMHLLVVSQIYYPGWHAEIDGQAAQLLQVNVVQQGVVIPAGEHLVRLTYWPDSFMWGLVISGMGLLICGSILLLLRYHPRIYNTDKG